MPNKYIDVRINEERFCTEGIAEFSLLIQFTLREAYRAESVWLAIRYALAWHDFPEGGMWNDFFSPLNRSDQPMPKVELKEKDGAK